MSIKLTIKAEFPETIAKPGEFEQSFELTIPGNLKVYFKSAEDMQKAHVVCNDIFRQIHDQLKK
jgi:hypothetical protein